MWVSILELAISPCANYSYKLLLDELYIAILLLLFLKIAQDQAAAEGQEVDSICWYDSLSYAR